MKKILFAALLALLPGTALAQSAVQLPIYIQNNNGQVADLGNGPLELRVVLGSAQIFTSQGSGLGATATTTAVTLAATPAVPPCVGCGISGSGIPAGDTVASYNGTTGIVLAVAATTTVASQTISWGAACPTTRGVNPVMGIQVGGGDLPLFTSARICGTAQFAAGAQVLPFAIGAH